jgi:hypothetical protein
MRPGVIDPLPPTSFWPCEMAKVPGPHNLHFAKFKSKDPPPQRLYVVVFVGASIDPAPKYFATMNKAKEFGIAAVNKQRIAEGVDIYEVRDVGDERAADRAFREGRRLYCQSVGRQSTPAELADQGAVWATRPLPTGEGGEPE